MVHEQVDDAVRELRSRYFDAARGPVIHDVRYTVDRDWTGDDAVHLTAVLCDPAGREFFEERELAPIRELFDKLLRERGVDRIPYVTFQLESEQAELAALDDDERDE